MTSCKVLLCVLSPAGCLLAGPILNYGPVAVKASYQFQGGTVTKDEGIVNPGDPQIFTVLEPMFDQRFPTSQSALPKGFVSALMTGTGFGGTGVSAISFNRETAVATAQYLQPIKNIGDADAELYMDYEIPQMEALVLVGPNGKGPFANANAQLLATHYLADGTLLTTQTIFLFTIQVEKIDFGDDTTDYFIERSEDLEKLQGDGIVFRDHDVFGLKYATFGETKKPIALLKPDETIVIEYILQSEGGTGNLTEVGFHALVGDPFEIGAAGGVRVSLAQAAAVPEPATLVLVPTGLVFTVAARRLRKRDATDS